uniref:Band_3_cyto domain-containing protein n=1 Tax=Schistocephalus solidus TaxID=70667 RepID=A0A183T889_SCHSO
LFYSSLVALRRFFNLPHACYFYAYPVSHVPSRSLIKSATNLGVNRMDTATAVTSDASVAGAPSTPSPENEPTSPLPVVLSVSPQGFRCNNCMTTPERVPAVILILMCFNTVPNEIAVRTVRALAGDHLLAFSDVIPARLSALQIQWNLFSVANRYDHHFFKKVPHGAEAVNILVGETDFLAHPVVAFARLKEAANLGEMTEVPVPTRFIFLLLGTQGNGHKYEQIGRAVGTLFSDEVFHEFAVRSTSKNDLLAGVDEFLSASLLLPPSQWDPKSRIDPPPTAPSEEIRRQLAAPSVGASASGRHQHHQQHQEADGNVGFLSSTVLSSPPSATPGDSGSENPSHIADIEAARSGASVGAGGGAGGSGGGGGGGTASQATEEAMDRNTNPALMRTGRGRRKSVIRRLSGNASFNPSACLLTTIARELPFSVACLNLKYLSTELQIYSSPFQMLAYRD